MATVRINVKKVVFETVLVLGVGLAVFLIRALASPRRQGFFCNDESIRFPKVRDTISDGVVALVTLAVPSIAVALCEVVRTGRVVPSGLSWRGAALPLWLVRVYRQNGVFILGAGLTVLTLDLAKNYVGQLRPNFLEACRPVPLSAAGVAGGNASDVAKLCEGATLLGSPVYVPATAYRCLGSERDEREARASFPSGHAGLAFYAAVYLALYVQARCRRVGGSACTLMRPLLQWLLLLVAWWICLSRVVDHVHHPIDVVAGAAMGTVFACLQVFLVSGLFAEEQAAGDQLVVLNPTKNNYAPSNCV